MPIKRGSMTLQSQQVGLGLEAAAIATQAAAGGDDAVARHDDGDPVGTVGAPHGPEAVPRLDPLGQVAIADVVPYGMRRSSAQTRSWNWLPGRSSGRSKSRRAPAKYSPSCTSSRSSSALVPSTVGPMRRRTAASWAGSMDRCAKSQRTMASSVAPASIGPIGVSMRLVVTTEAASGWQCRQGR